MDAPVRDSERSPKGDHNRRLALGIDPDVFAREAGVTTEELRDYERTGPDQKFELEVAHKVGVALERYESGAIAIAKPDDDGGPDPFIRPAGLEDMHDAPADWAKTDEAADESFPASDPPANGRFTA